MRSVSAKFLLNPVVYPEWWGDNSSKQNHDNYSPYKKNVQQSVRKNSKNEDNLDIRLRKVSENCFDTHRELQYSSQNN